MNFRRIDFSSFKAWAEVASFEPDAGVKEYHAWLHVDAIGDRFDSQLDRLQQAYRLLIAQYPSAQVVMRRYVLSDIANQMPLLHARLGEEEQGLGAISVIGQPPLDGSKVALWIYLAEGLEVENHENLTLTRHNGYEHRWTTNYHSLSNGSYAQTAEILERYEDELTQQQMTLGENCLRTWFYIRDVDTHYHGMVVARRENFEAQQLTPQTHYIASTGIGGAPIEQQSLVQMDAYAAQGLRPEQQCYLHAATHLNPTHEYGVTFERGTAITYGDRRHLLISGTASINNRGEVMHTGDIIAQTERMLENISTLLAEGGASMTDIAQSIVYLRDVADYPIVQQLLKKRLPNLPCVITLAPVCRPAWLIEMECIAIITTRNNDYRSF